MSEKETTPDQHLVQAAQKIIEEAAKMIKDLLDALNNKLQKDAAAKVSAEEKKREREEMMEMISALLEKHGFKPTPENVDATARKAERLNEIDQEIKAAEDKINEIDKKIEDLDAELNDEQALNTVDEDKLKRLNEERGNLRDQRADEIAGISRLKNEKEELLNDNDLANSLMDSVDSQDFANSMDSVDSLDTQDFVTSFDSMDSRDFVDSPDSMDSQDFVNSMDSVDSLDSLDSQPGNDLKGAPAAGGDAAKAPAVEAPAVEAPEMDAPAAGAKLPGGGGKGIKGAIAGKALAAAAPALKVAAKGVGAVADVAKKGGEIVDNLSNEIGEKLNAQAKKGPISKKLVEGKDFALGSVASKLGSACDWLNSLKESIEGLKRGKKTKEEKNSKKQKHSNSSSVT